MDFLSNLNPQQRTAVTTKPGQLVILAGPGSGKTRVLAHRIAYLIGELNVHPYQILAVTFTNKAARVMENRVFDLLGSEAHGLTLGTFHATCARIIRREAQYLPVNSNFVIFDSDDQKTLVKQALKDLDIDDKRHHPRKIHAAISNAKNMLLLPEEFPIQTYPDKIAARVYERYQELLLTSNAVDFDDLLLWTAYLLDEQPGVREKYSRRYEYILVDEFQDTNLAQYTLLKHLASHHSNIFVVGDSDQSIYRWRGADYRNLKRFEEDFSRAQVLLLEQNYRSTQAILDVAMAVIDKNPHRKPKRLFTDRKSGQKITLYESFDDRAEAIYVVDTIASLIGRKQAQPGDFAIMYRTNAQSRLLEEAFLHANLPYKLVGAQRFYGRREVKDIIAHLRVVHNPNDEVSLLRIINTPTRGIGNKTKLSLRTYAKKKKLSPGTVLLELSTRENSPHWEAFSKRAAKVLSNFGALLNNWRTKRDELSPLGLMDHILSDIEYKSYIDDGTEEGQERWENVLELRRLAGEYKNKSIDAFLEQVALVSDQDTMDIDANVPTLLTLHAAKGLEFPIVFIVGLNDGILPHGRSFEDPEAMQEERRLLYVGITRTKDRLFLVYAQNRSAYGFSEPTEPSRYLSDIPVSLIEGTQPTRSGLRTEIYTKDQSLKRWLDKRKPPKKKTSPRFQPGAHVEHHTWGEGIVLNSLVQDDDEIVDIFFDGTGLKRVAASLAKLKIIHSET